MHFVMFAFLAKLFQKNKTKLYATKKATSASTIPLISYDYLFHPFIVLFLSLSVSDILNNPHLSVRSSVAD